MSVIYGASKFALEGMSEALAKKRNISGEATMGGTGGYWTDLYTSMSTAIRGVHTVHCAMSWRSSIPNSVDSDRFTWQRKPLMKLVASNNPPLKAYPWQHGIQRGYLGADGYRGKNGKLLAVHQKRLFLHRRDMSIIPNMVLRQGETIMKVKLWNIADWTKRIYEEENKNCSIFFFGSYVAIEHIGSTAILNPAGETGYRYIYWRFAFAELTFYQRIFNAKVSPHSDRYDGRIFVLQNIQMKFWTHNLLCFGVGMYPKAEVYAEQG